MADKISKPAKPKPPTGGVSGFFRRLWNTLIFYRVGILANLIEIFTFHRKFDLQKVARRPGEVAVVTGGGRGIGIEIVKKLLILDMHVVIGCRNKTSGSEAVEKLRNSGIVTGTTNVLALDLTSLQSVRDFANKIIVKYPKIHVLINNGGIMSVPYSVTVDGNESQFQVNYLSHFLLTNLLLPKLIRGGRAGKASRIVNVSSAAHYGGKINFDDINMTQMYCKSMAYMSSKLMQVVSTKHLNAKLEKEGVHLRVYAVHPGVVQTDLYANICLIRTFKFLFRLVYKTPQQGADGVVYAAISSKFEGEGGHFFSNCKISSVNSLATKSHVAQKLWDLSCRMTSWEDIPLHEIVKTTMIAVRKGPSLTEPPPPQRQAPPLRKKSVDRQRKVSDSRKLERQERVDIDSAEGNKPTAEQPRASNHVAIPPRISIASASSSSISSSSNVSTNTIVGGNDQVAVVIIPATATEASESDGDDFSFSGKEGSETRPEEVDETVASSSSSSLVSISSNDTATEVVTSEFVVSTTSSYQIRQDDDENTVTNSVTISEITQEFDFLEEVEHQPDPDQNPPPLPPRP